MVAMTVGANLAADLAGLGPIVVVAGGNNLADGQLRADSRSALKATKEGIDGRYEREDDKYEAAKRPRYRLQPC